MEAQAPMGKTKDLNLKHLKDGNAADLIASHSLLTVQTVFLIFDLLTTVKKQTKVKNSFLKFTKS